MLPDEISLSKNGNQKSVILVLIILYWLPVSWQASPLFYKTKLCLKSRTYKVGNCTELKLIQLYSGFSWKKVSGRHLLILNLLQVEWIKFTYFMDHKFCFLLKFYRQGGDVDGVLFLISQYVNCLQCFVLKSLIMEMYLHTQSSQSHLPC